MGSEGFGLGSEEMELGSEGLKSGGWGGQRSWGRRSLGRGVGLGRSDREVGGSGCGVGVRSWARGQGAWGSWGRGDWS